MRYEMTDQNSDNSKKSDFIIYIFFSFNDGTINIFRQANHSLNQNCHLN